ncbi:MAG: hypothetical protein H7A51_13095 [Akkermansiaceae bacterium]|nr:hypothetical protein [Akkermansiaceae bacterium]
MINSHKSARGFALIATISVMVLLVMIALAMLTLSAIEARSSGGDDQQAIARANARMALMLAIGELQKHAGADRRVTAEASILEDPDGATTLANRHWLGVWRTDGLKAESVAISQPLIYRSKETTGSFASSLKDRRADGTYQPEAEVLDWLVSHPGAASTVDPTLPLASNQRITLVGDNSVAQTTEQVHAGKINVIRNGNHAGNLAWWVGDENLKSRFDLAEPDAANLVNSNIPAQNSPSIVSEYGGYETLDAETIPKLITRSNADLSGLMPVAAAQTARRKYFHDFTFSSRSLLVDTQNGGLRKDLTSFINQGSAPDLLTHKGLTADTPILDATNLKDISPKFGLIQKWATAVTGSTASRGITPMAPKGINGGFTWGWNTNFNYPCNAINLAKQDTPAIHPIMIDAGISYGASL